MGRSGRAVLQRAEQLGITPIALMTASQNIRQFLRRLAGRYDALVISPIFHTTTSPRIASADGT